MLLLKSSSLPDDDGWIREIKVDGYRAIAFKSAGKLELLSRNDNDMAVRYPAIARALAKFRDDTVIDGELAALDADGRPSFNLLQNYGKSTGPLVYFIFDLLVLSGRDLRKETLKTRRGLLETKIMPKLAGTDPSISGTRRQYAGADPVNRLEGLVAKRKHNVHEPGPQFIPALSAIRTFRPGSRNFWFLPVIHPRRDLRALIVSRRALDFRVDHCSDKQR
jgi:ATP-dependent DNA ligase